ncbi:MAG: thermonuclease family protein [Nannocystis sp.]|uniref:thermonuclease family protein n=1 Tax=Nannocystis sp. TaxID=1962667 RepID=UPI002421E8E0|nr:thermonuclease family protein [Nannocystis sp.]MBK9758043.1 thermonuclease family protein [Nannocystis sp.]
MPLNLRYRHSWRHSWRHSLGHSLGALGLVLGLALLQPACAQPIQRYDRTNVLAGLEREEVGLHLGHFPLTKVIDGDTIRVDGLDASMRLLGLDTEETFKRKSEWRDFDKGWERYLADAQAKTSHPVKIPTPMGEEAKKYAVKFFQGVRFVELERDHPKEIRDFYNRYLTYVFVEKDGKRLNYNIECVRAGMSPYFTKYGISRRFHNEFIAAQDEARKAQRGIWDPTKQHYPDYDRRLAWWNRRGEYVQAFERDSDGKKDWVVLTHWDAMDRIQGLLGREVVVLGAVGDIRPSKTGGPTKVMLSRRRSGSFPLIFFDKQILAESHVESAKGEFIRARGVVAKYRNKYTNRDEYQILVTIPAQVEIEVLSPTAASTPPAASPASPDVAPAPIAEPPVAPELPGEPPPGPPLEPLPVAPTATASPPSPP